MFLDYFGLKKLEDLPPLADLSDWESLRVQLDLPEVDEDVVEEVAMPTERPVLLPEGDDAELDELVVSEWPDPTADLVTESDDDDQDASASGG